MTQPEVIELGAPKMMGQFLASGPMSHFKRKHFKKMIYPTKYIH